MKTINEEEFRILCQEACANGGSSITELWKHLHTRLCQELEVDQGMDPIYGTPPSSEAIYVQNLQTKLNARKIGDFKGLDIASEYISKALKL